MYFKYSFIIPLQRYAMPLKQQACFSEEELNMIYCLIGEHAKTLQVDQTVRMEFIYTDTGRKYEFALGRTRRMTYNGYLVEILTTK